MKKENIEQLKDKITESGYTQNELADRAKISRNTIMNIVSGRTTPSYFALKSLAISLNFSPEEFIATFIPEIKLQTKIKA